MNDAKLPNCPLCGGDSLRMGWRDVEYARVYRVRCDGCGFKGANGSSKGALESVRQLAEQAAKARAFEFLASRWDEHAKGDPFNDGILVEARWWKKCGENALADERKKGGLT